MLTYCKKCGRFIHVNWKRPLVRWGICRQCRQSSKNGFKIKSSLKPEKY